MSRNCFVALVVALACVLMFSSSVLGRMALGAEKKDDGRWFSTQAPSDCQAMHRVGELVLSVGNNGSFGTAYGRGSDADCFTGQPIPGGGCEYPKNSGATYLFGASFWIGAVVGRDTLVSVGHDGWIGTTEFFPDETPFGDMIKRSILDPTDLDMYEDAVSEEDYIAVYMDTFIALAGADAEDGGRVHRPLNIEVTQSSYAWSYSYAEDLVLFDYKIKNIGIRNLENVYMGVYVDADVCFNCDGVSGAVDDICGFLPYYEYFYGPKDMCSYEDNPFIAWIADNDGDIGSLDPAVTPVPHVTATRIVRTPSKKLDVSFNWWVSNATSVLDFGPRMKETEDDPWRDFGHGGVGTPWRDDNKYYVLSNGEFDYNQIYTANIQATDDIWVYPNQSLAVNFSDGYDTRYLLSFGPFDISPGQTLPLSLSYLAGEDFHTVNDNLDNLAEESYNPKAFEEGLDFDDLADNARWASWIYDNPGVDTDGDGYAGDSVTCVTESTFLETVWLGTPGEPPFELVWDFTTETFFTKGDDVPDFKGANPPPAPDFWIYPSPGKLLLRFNGYRSENAKDVFSGDLDFEGYRIYLGRDERSESYSMVTSYDREDYNKFIYEGDGWVLRDVPYTLEQLLSEYGITDPLQYTRTQPFVDGSELYYFEAQDFNSSELGIVGGIRKIYPDQPRPLIAHPDFVKPEELTEDGYLKYYEYEYTIDNLLPNLLYWVNITAFDYGSPGKGLEALETSRTVGHKSAYALYNAQDASKNNEEVFVYPNPYRVDGGYRALGLEGRESNQSASTPDDRVRAVHFANLPSKCTISIFSLDGDLIQVIDHDFDPSDPKASHDRWDLITRNTQLIVSGIYFWTVEGEDGEVQVGKLAIIM
ncbi:MAG: hypothetical protein KOO62_13575 [candidate division Zixibacteria bacterium]|nr:hypothetical protein [candidate division Zixibacteria bacterium]